MTKRSVLLHSVGKRKTAPTGDRAASGDGVREKGENFYKSGRQVRLNKMYNAKPDLEKMTKIPTEPARIAPSRKWFDNTRVVSQAKLEQFREALANRKLNPRMVLVKSTKLPVSLFDHSKESRNKRAANLLSVEPYEETFSSSESFHISNRFYKSTMQEESRRNQDLWPLNLLTTLRGARNPPMNMNNVSLNQMQTTRMATSLLPTVRMTNRFRKDRWIR